MRTFPVAFASFLLLAGAQVFACGGSSGSSGFGDGGTASSGGSSGGGSSSGTSSGSNGSSGCGLTGCSSGGSSGGPPPQCMGLQCQHMACSNGGQTSLTGHVYDPAGNLPLYNVYVYVPNTTPQPITAGDPTCTQCEAPASGNPIVGASTDATGKFNVVQGSSDPFPLPDGQNIPLVIQVGKWRKQLVIPKVNPCVANDLDIVFNQGTGTAKQLRLPAKTSEGDMPLIAFTSGCDPAECFLRHIGIDDSEFVPPTSATGHVHFYTAQDLNSAGAGSAVSGGNTPADTYTWWTQSTNLLKYDIVFNACECNPNPRGNGAYGAMHTFLNGGGRLFTTHYYYNWFTDGPPDFQQVVAWAPELAMGYSSYFVDTSFPKGKAYGQWLVANSIATSTGNDPQIAVTDTRNDVNGSGPPTYPNSTRWIYNADMAGSSTYSSSYLSFNAPIGQPVTSQCGRAVFSDVHLSGSSDDSTFPGECANADPGGSHAINEKALEFLFFDLSSCVQNDTQPPPPPPPAQ